MTIRKVVGITSLFILGALIVVFFSLYRAFQTGALQKALVERVSQQIAPTSAERDIVTEALGFKGTKTYLVLLLNNTELRPGGGFIGAYAVVQFTNAIPTVLKVEGTEILDNAAPKDPSLVPPAPLKKYVKVSQWYFRDSNWSPDFRSSSEAGLALYAKQRGLAADELDGVIGFTPTVIEHMLEIGGPIVMNGQEYNSKNFTEKLEYEVEYGFKDKGVSFSDRKKTLGALGDVLVKRLRSQLITHWGDYQNILSKMLAQKQLVLYATVPADEALVVEKGWAGAMTVTSSDYLLWADANLGALKTDAAIDRNITYAISPTSSPSSSGYVATVSMQYNHTGSFDWRTSRYRTYARLFVPEGSKLIKGVGALDNDRPRTPGKIDEGDENGYHWFGAFTAVEPGTTGTLSFTYFVSPTVADRIRNNSYRLLAQKQIGTIGTPLTMQFNFGKTGKGDIEEKYSIKTTLDVDRIFSTR